MTTGSCFTAASVALLLSGCGGGVYLGYEWGDDHPPRVDLVASATEALPGEAVRLVASASDSSGYVDRVTFYRYDGNRLQPLGTDRSAPFEAVLVVPADGRPVVNVVAEAVDGDGESATSGIVGVTVR